MDIRVRRVRVRQDAFFRQGDACPGATMRGRTVNFTTADVGGVFFIESANRVEIIDCDIWATSNFAYIYDSRNVVIRGNRIRYGNFGLRLGHTVRALVADNDIAGISWVAGGSIFLSMYEYAGGGQTGTQNFVTIRNNTIHDVYGRDREAITSDGGTTAFFGTLAAVHGRALTLQSDPVFVMDPTQHMQNVHADWTGTAVYIMHGPGQGQWRRVTANAGRHWEIQEPFAVPPVPGMSVYKAFQSPVSSNLRCLFDQMMLLFLDRTHILRKCHCRAQRGQHRQPTCLPHLGGEYHRRCWHHPGVWQPRQ